MKLKATEPHFPLLQLIFFSKLVLFVRSVYPWRQVKVTNIPRDGKINAITGLLSGNYIFGSLLHALNYSELTSSKFRKRN